MLLALDLGETFGWCVGDIKEDRALASGSIHLKPKSDGKHTKQYNNFHRHLQELVSEYSVNELAIEGALFQRAAARARFYGYKGLVDMMAENLNVKVLSYHPMTLKKFFTYSGKASKDDMVGSAIKMGYDIMDDNHADAIAVWHYHKYLVGRRLI